MSADVHRFVFDGVLNSDVMAVFPSSLHFSIPYPLELPFSAYQTAISLPESASYSNITLLSRSATTDIISRTAGLPLCNTAPHRPGEVLYHRVARDVEELNRVNPPMTVAAYMDINGRDNERVFDAGRLGKIRYEGS